MASSTHGLRSGYPLKKQRTLLPSKTGKRKVQIFFPPEVPGEKVGTGEGDRSKEVRSSRRLKTIEGEKEVNGTS